MSENEEEYRKRIGEEIQDRINEEVVIEIVKKMPRAKYARGMIVKGRETEIARRIISREYEIDYLDTHIKWLKSERRLITEIATRDIPTEAQPMLYKKYKEKDEEIKILKEKIEELYKQKEAEGLAGIKIL